MENLSAKVIPSTKVKCSDGRIVEIKPLPKGYRPDERIVKMKAMAAARGLR